MDINDFEAMEVRPENSGWYFVTLFQFEKEEKENPDYIKDWVEYDGEAWQCDGYENCYVCFIHNGDESV